MYVRALEAVGRRAPEVLLIDNHLDYLVPFRAMGGQVLLIDEDGAVPDLPPGVPRLRDVKQLPAWLASAA